MQIGVPDVFSGSLGRRSRRSTIPTRHNLKFVRLHARVLVLDSMSVHKLHSVQHMHKHGITLAPRRSTPPVARRSRTRK